MPHSYHLITVAVIRTLISASVASISTVIRLLRASPLIPLTVVLFVAEFRSSSVTINDPRLYCNQQYILQHELAVTVTRSNTANDC